MADKLNTEELLGLAPSRLEIKRDERYQGGRYDLTLADDFTEDEVEIIKEQYKQLTALMELTDTHGTVSASDFQRVSNYAQNADLLALADQIQDIIQELTPSRCDRLGRVLYKMVTGAYSSLCNYLMLIKVGGMEPEYVQTMHYLSFDHLKVMRAFIADLDPDKRAEDEMPKLHSIQKLIEKWRDMNYRILNHPIDISFIPHFEGYIAERCLELAEIDNIFYHIVNNCASYSKDKCLDVYVIELEDKQNLRWVFTNQVTPDHKEAIKALKASGESLFEHGSTTNGTQGYGLGMLGASIVHAYGLEDLYEGREQGYFGTSLRDDMFVLWFHWPLVDGA